jgi:hypothetical protein
MLSFGFWVPVFAAAAQTRRADPSVQSDWASWQNSIETNCVQLL